MAFFKWNLSAWSVFVTGGITGGYVLYKDSMRTKHMIQKFTNGNILPPLDEIQHQEAYFCRPHLENELRHVLSSTCSQCYYLVRGDVGVGKSRLVLETVKRMCDETKRAGAPVYVSVAQGKTFSESLAKCVGFQFDEHINFSFYLDVLFRVCSFPSKEEDHRLLRTLDAFEKSASHYARTYKKPVVLVIDEADSLTAKSLLTMQQKAKFWADTNIAKVVFIINSTDTEQELQKQECLWSRVACPILVDDLCENDAFNFLMQGSLVGSASSPVGSMEIKDAKEIVSIAGGRLLHLITFKHAFITGVSLRETANKLIAKECEKFIHVSKEPLQWKAVQLLVTAPDKSLLLDGNLTTMDQVITTRNESINKIMLRLPELYVCDTDELTTVQRRITCRDQAFNMALEKFPLSPELHVTIKLKDETLLFIGKTNYCNEIYREFQNWLCFYEHILPGGGSEVCAVLIENDVWTFFKDVMADELMKLVDDRNYTLESVTPTSPPNAAEKKCNIYLSARHPNIKNNDHLDQIKLFVRTWLRRIEIQKFLYTKEPKDKILLSGLAEVKCMYCSLRVEETETELIFWGPRPIPSQAIDLFLLLIGQDKALQHILEVSARLNNRPILTNVDLNVWLYVESIQLKLHGMPFSDLKFTAQQEDDGTENCFVLCRGRRLNENEERLIRRMYQDAFNKVSLVTFEPKSYTTTPQECNLALEEIKCMYSSLLVRETDDEIIFIAIAPQPQKAMSDFKKLLGVKNAASKPDIAGNKKSSFTWCRKKSTEVAEVSKTTAQLDKRQLSVGEPLKWRDNQIYEKRPSQIAKKTSGATASSLVPKCPDDSPHYDWHYYD